MSRLHDHAKIIIKHTQEKMKNAYPIQVIKQIFKKEDKVTMY